MYARMYTTGSIHPWCMREREREREREGYAVWIFAESANTVMANEI